MKYFSQNPRDYFLLAMMLYYIHTSQLRKDILIRPPEIIELGTTGSETAITISNSRYEQLRAHRVAPLKEWRYLSSLLRGYRSVLGL
eukprot:SAG31_NODE_18357_length_639_cov_0.920370_1_plen_87_part_00